MADVTAKKQRGKPFPAGQSGNPTGRPKGVLNKATRAAQALLDGEVEALTRKAVEMALDGNIQALKLCLERLLPPCKERPLSVPLPKVTTASDLPLLTEALLNAVGSGKLTAGEASALASLITGHGRALEWAELERRVAILENKSGGK